MDSLCLMRQFRYENKYSRLCIEGFSRWPKIHPLKTMEAKEVANVLYKKIFTSIESPSSLMSDYGSHFFLRHIVTACGQAFRVKRLRTSNYHSASNDACGRFNWEIHKCLKACCTNQQYRSSNLPARAMAYWSTVTISSTQYSPYLLMFERQMPLPTLQKNDNNQKASSKTGNNERNCPTKRETSAKPIQEKVRQKHTTTQNSYPEH